MNTALIHSLLGKPWVAGATGPESFDCWGLLAFVYQAEFGININPDLDRQAGNIADNVRVASREIASGHWEAVSTPQDGDAVGLSQGGPIHHVGLFLAQNRAILHSLPEAGVTVQPIRSLKSNGFSIFQYYRHVAR